MAGWSMIAADESGLDSTKSAQKKLQTNGCWVDLESVSKGSGLKTLSLSIKELHYRLHNFLKSFLKEICAIDNGFWPLLPMLGRGQIVNLLKLFLVVKDNGGYEAVCKNGLWDLVARESGFCSSLASSVKLVYINYLDALEKWLQRLVVDKDSKPRSRGALMELEAKFEGFLSEMTDLKYLEMKSELNVSADVESSGGDKGVVVDDDEESRYIDLKKSVAEFVEVGKSSDEVVKRGKMDSFSEENKKCKDIEENLLSNLTKSVEASNEDEAKSVVVGMVGSEKGDEDGDMELVSDVDEELIACRKRKRESMCRMLTWVRGIARNPSDPVVVPLPERSKWKSYGIEESWKQVLFIREALLLKRHVDLNVEQSIWQKNQKMHPCMYDDHVGSSYNLRERLRFSKKLLPGKTSSQGQSCSQSSSSVTRTDSESCMEGICDGDSSTEDSVLDLPIIKRIPLGPDFQAEVPEWNGVVFESDSKWVGTQVWPLENVECKLIIEREPIGKGRQDLCGCQFPKSIECVRFHITEKKLRLKCELGMAFYHWRFDNMGEEVKLSWMEEEEKKFKAIVRSNCPSLDGSFWDEIFKFFPTKRREDLVSYYFNVFLLHRRAHQNRSTPNNIGSDDDESECGLESHGSGHEASKSPGSLLSSAKKRRKHSD